MYAAHVHACVRYRICSCLLGKLREAFFGSVLSAAHKMKSQSMPLPFYLLQAMIGQITYCCNEKCFIRRYPAKKRKNKKKAGTNPGPQWVIDLALLNWSQIAKLIPSCETSGANPDAFGISSVPHSVPSPSRHLSWHFVYSWLLFITNALNFTHLVKSEIFFYW